MNNNYNQNSGNNNTQNFNYDNNFQQNNLGNVPQMNGMSQNNMMNQNQMSNVPQMNDMSQNNMMGQNQMSNVPQMDGMSQNNMINQNQMSNVNNQQQVNMIKQKLNKAHKINLRKKKKLHMTKKKVAVLSVVACFLFVVLIGLGIFTYTKLNGYTRTIMIYMSGTDLEATKGGLATFDLNSIDYKKMDNKNINVVLIAGGSTTWHNNYIDKNSTSIYELTEDGFEVVKKQKLLNMGKSKTLSDFINYVTDNYKSEKYSLIFWNHGGALGGTNFDPLFDDDSLLIDEIDTALSKTKFAKTKLENVIFRTCLNGTIEYADLFAKYADYMVASEEITIGMAGYHVLNYINDIDVKDDSYEVGKRFVDAYKDQVNGIREDYKRRGAAGRFNSYSTYSIVDLDNVDELIHNLNEFMSDIDIDKNFNTVAKTRAKIYEYGKGGSDTVDLYSLVSELKDLSPEKAEAVLKSFDEAVLYNWATSNESRGLSIYFPYSGTKSAKDATLDMYSKIDSLDDYNDFISNFALIQSSGAGKSVLSFSGNNISVTNNNDSSDFVLELTEEQKNVYAKSKYFVFKLMDNGEFWPFYIGNSAKLSGNKLVANVRGRGLEIYDPITNTSSAIPLIESYEDDEYIKYEISVFLEKNKGDFNNRIYESAVLNLDYNKNIGEITIGEMVYYTENGVSNVAVNLSEYSHVVIGSNTYNLSDEYGNISVSNMKTGSRFYGVEVPINSIQFRLADYSSTMSENYATFIINDIYGNAYVTELIKMS